MPDRKQGFDPLSSLFEVPDPAIGNPHLEVDPTEETTRTTQRGHVDLTDPHFKTPQDLPAPPSRTSGSLGALSDEDAPTESVEMPSDTALDPIAIARAVGKAAAAKAAAQKPVHVRKSHAEREAFEDAAMSSLAERAAKGPRMDAGSFLNELPRPDTNEEPAPRYGVKRSRTEAMAARMQPPMSALEAARVAAEREEEARKIQESKDARTHAQQLSDRIQEMVPRLLPNAGAIYVANALRVEQRHILGALWRSHRARFMSDGQLERAVGAAAVLHALDSVSEAGLVVAHVVTDASDYLIWLDLDQDTVLAAFSDARAYFAGQA